MERNSLRKLRIEQGLCRDCGASELLPAKNVCHDCFVARSLRQKIRKSKLETQGICIQCKAEAMPEKTLCSQCMQIIADNARLRRKENKIAIVAKYGGKCQHCGEMDIRCLTLDHINNDGNIDPIRKNRKMTGANFYGKLIKIDRRKDLMLLCANCHYKKDLAPWWYEEE